MAIVMVSDKLLFEARDLVREVRKLIESLPLPLSESAKSLQDSCDALRALTIRYERLQEDEGETAGIVLRKRIDALKMEFEEFKASLTAS